MQIEEWALKEIIEKESDQIEANVARWTKYDLLKLSQDMDSFFDYLETHSHLNKIERDSLERAKLSFEKIFYGSNKLTNKAN